MDETTMDTNSDGRVTPDEETVSRIKHLAIVGTAIKEAFSERNQDFGGDLTIAKESLDNFRKAILKLKLDEKTSIGMLHLIEYLQKKLDKRIAGKSRDY